MTDSDITVDNAGLELNFRQFGESGSPLLVLHGLFGSLSNWAWHCRKLAETYRVFALDMRNHGASPHSDQMSYPAMAQDVKRFMDQQGIDKALVLGHSMGGKVAMQLALSWPERVQKLVVADISPVYYGGDGKGEHDDIFSGLNAIDLEAIESRKDADTQLAKWEPDEIVRQFLLSNLVRAEGGGFAWRINLESLQDNYDALRDAPEGERQYQGPVIFIRGDESRYVQSRHKEDILVRFPAAEVKTIMQAGHWLHAEKPETFFRIVSGFLQDKE